MARSLNMEDIKRGDLLRVWPEDLVVDLAKRGRAFAPTAERIQELGLSIAEKGQLQPVPVTITHDKRLELAAGFTRWESLMWLNTQNGPDERRRIECKVIDANAEESFLANIAENKDRNITTAIDDAHNIRRLAVQFHKTDEEIRLIYSVERNQDGTKKPMSPQWLENMRSLLSLDREQQQQIHLGQISQSVGVVLATLAPEERKPLLEKVQEESKGKVTTTKLVKAAREKGVLTKKTGLRMPEVTSAWQYLREHDKNPRVTKLARAVMQWQSGAIAEPDFFGMIHDLLGC